MLKFLIHYRKFPGGFTNAEYRPCLNDVKINAAGVAGNIVLENIALSPSQGRSMELIHFLPEFIIEPDGNMRVYRETEMNFQGRGRDSRVGNGSYLLKF